MNSRYSMSLALSRLLLGAALIGAYPAGAAEEVPTFATPPSRSEAPSQVIIPAAPQVAATAYVLMDARTGVVIAEKNADERLPPASLTKMMTSYVLDYEVARGNVGFDDEVPISVRAWKTGGSKMFIQEGTRVRLEDLLRGIIIQSGNDASVAVAEYLAGSEQAFATIMNGHAQRLGMQNTQFSNATGLPSPDNYSTAFDLALLAQAIVYDFPQQYPIYSEKHFTYNKIRQPNRNLLLWRDKSIDGLKTGHTEEAGYCLVASAVRDEMRLITVVLGAKSQESRAQETMKLMNYGFRFFETLPLYQAGAKLVDSKIFMGVEDLVALGTGEAVTLTIPKGQKAALDIKLDIDESITAPITKGQVLGSLVVSLEDNVLAKRPVVALQDVAEAGIFKRLWHTIWLFVTGLFD
ncbi:D-alanyl-D-alanine carboxypeptidase family protein [Allohahella marinimesophila]|uniref:serine-type D-Ala-D-Ala carboxypeptidase n=1 Tax=Allohahella marinimesophila TaxID=1054972 RepID=A0ABP7NHM5_9GAMM